MPFLTRILTRLTRLFILTTLPLFFTAYSAQAQFINWVFLPEGQVENSCVSTSNYANGQVCYGLEYTPGVTGMMTSYTMGFFIECPSNFSPSIQSSSCSLQDNSEIYDGCSALGVSLLQASANNATFNLTANQPVIIHQVCMDFHFLDSLGISIDPVTGISVSIDQSGGNPITDRPPFNNFQADYSVFEIVPCSDTSNCSVFFGLGQEEVSFQRDGNNKIVIADTANNNDVHTERFDVYDEVNNFCEVAGGLEDIEVSIKVLHSYDVYGNGVINEYVGSDFYVEQNANGIGGNIPFGSNANTESSSGDVRGYEVEVQFEDHLNIKANQLNLFLKNPNQANSIFETASVIYYGQEGFPYGTSTYNGYYDTSANLEGGCLTSPLGTPYTTEGNGTNSIADVNRINAFNPCAPEPGSMGPDTLIWNAFTDGGLDSNDVITGFKLIVLGEDIATPVLVDNGSNMGGEDDVAGNRPTSTNTSMLTSLIGYAINGCVFSNPEQNPLKVDITSSHNYISIGDTVRYDIDLINKSVDSLHPVLLEVDFPSEFINIQPGPGGVVNGQSAEFDNLLLLRLDTNDYHVTVNLSPTAPENDQIVDIVEGTSDFIDNSIHHTFQDWNISNTMPRSGSQHWYAPSDTALAIKYLVLKETIVPSASSTLSFYHKYETELHRDGGQVEVSLDQGDSWTSLSSYFTNNGYNDYINRDTNQAAFSGSSGGYVLSEIDLSSFDHQSLLIRFKLFSDIESAADGWYIDDIIVSGLYYNLPVKATASYDTFMVMDVVDPQTHVVPCTDVFSVFNEGQGTLRRAIACASLVDSIEFLPGVLDDTIELSTSIFITKDLIIDGSGLNIKIQQNQDFPIFELISSSNSVIRSIGFLHPGQGSSSTLINNGDLQLLDCTIIGNASSSGKEIINTGTLDLNTSNTIKKE